jgi:hypothetical protein
MKIPISRDSFILRFLLPDENSSLGANICQHVFLETTHPITKEIIKRPYHLITNDLDKGIVDIMIKVYNKKDNNFDYGYFSNYLANLEVDSKINMKYFYEEIKLST